MSQSMEDRTITAKQAWAEFELKCQEVNEIETVLVYLENGLVSSLKRAEPVVAVGNDVVAVCASDAFWQLLDLYREAETRRRDLFAARDYVYLVYQAALLRPYDG